MGTFKEEATAFEIIERNAKQIWNDACDIGVAYNTNDIPLIVKECINAAKYLNSTGLVKSRDADTDNGYVKCVYRIGWEIDEGYETGTEYTVEFCKITKPKHPALIKKGSNAFINVHSNSYRSKV